MRIFTKGILPLIGIAFWVWLSFYLAQGIMGESGMFEWWIVAGVPFGFFKMRHWLIPSGGASLTFTVAIWALNLILCGLLGGFAVIFCAIKSVVNIIKGIFRMEIE